MRETCKFLAELATPPSIPLGLFQWFMVSFENFGFWDSFLPFEFARTQFHGVAIIILEWHP